MADSFVETPDGLLLVANGFDPVLRWDGQTTLMETAGVVAPDQTPTLTGTGIGSIVGTYFAFMRYVDRLDNFSNLSPISLAYTAQSTTGTITGATNATPIVITSPNHGLQSTNVVKVTGVGGNDSANNTWSITVIDANNFSLDTSSGTATYTGGGTWIAGVGTIVYGNLETPSDQKITRRQILRNTDGEASTFYVDIDTDDLSSHTLSSTLTDEQLLGQIAVPLLDSDGAAVANVYYPPPNHKGVMVSNLGRMFFAVQFDYLQGACIVNFGSYYVQGVGTEWTVSMANRFLYVVGAAQPYEIASVDAVKQIITLVTPYQDTSSNMAVYAIRPAPGEERLIYYSEAGLPEAVPPFNTIQLQVDGDDITGLLQMNSFVYFLEARHMYRFTFQSDPAKDGAVFLASQRGCINHRCVVIVEDSAYMLDQQGIHQFTAGQSNPVGQDVQQIFRPGEIDPYKINWKAAPYFHGVLFATQQVIRWFVCLSGDELPRHAIAFNYRLQRWWVEEFRVPIPASCFGLMSKIPTVFLGGPGRAIYSFWLGYLDGPDAGAGTVQGKVTSAGLLSLTDSSASYAAAGIVGSPVAIVAGTGKGQMRLVVNQSGQTLSIDQPWTTMPDTTSVYQVGAIQWLYRAAWFPFVPVEEYNTRRFQLAFNSAVNPVTCDMRLLFDFTDQPVTWSTTIASDQGDGIQSTAGDVNLIVDFTRPNGVVQKNFSAERELFATGPRWGQVELQGFTNNDQVAIYQITFDGVARQG